MFAFLAVLRHALSTLLPAGTDSGGVRRDGEFRVQHPSGVLIERGLREVDLQAVAGLKFRDMRTGYRWYSFPRAEIAGRTIAMSICFFQDALEFITVDVVTEDEVGDPWKNWSAEKELARVEAARQWLADIGCPVGEYTWGTVFAELDNKGGGGGGGVRFH